MSSTNIIRKVYLGKWLHCQKRKYDKHLLNLEQSSKLDELVDKDMIKLDYNDDAINEVVLDFPQDYLQTEKNSEEDFIVDIYADESDLRVNSRDNDDVDVQSKSEYSQLRNEDDQLTYRIKPSMEPVRADTKDNIWISPSGSAMSLNGSPKNGYGSTNGNFSMFTCIYVVIVSHFYDSQNCCYTNATKCSVVCYKTI